MPETPETLEHMYARYRQDPVAYLKEIHGLRLTPAQEELFRIVIKNPNCLFVRPQQKTQQPRGL